MASDSSVFVVHESGPTVLATDLLVVGHRPGETITSTASPGFTITAGSSVCSYLIVADTPGRDRPIDAVIGSDATILGFVLGAVPLAETSVHEAPGFSYGYNPIEGTDSLTVDGQVVIVDLDATGVDRDQIRMFTACS